MSNKSDEWQGDGEWTELSDYEEGLTSPTTYFILPQNRRIRRKKKI